jgi:hypothetical protein
MSSKRGRGGILDQRVLTRNAALTSRSEDTDISHRSTAVSDSGQGGAAVGRLRTGWWRGLLQGPTGTWALRTRPGKVLGPTRSGDGKMALWTLMPSKASSSASTRCCHRRNAAVAATRAVNRTRRPLHEVRPRLTAVHRAGSRPSCRLLRCWALRCYLWIAPAVKRHRSWSPASTSRPASAARCALPPAPSTPLSAPPS